MRVDLQNLLFKYFTDTLAAIILQAKRNGRWDMGILGEWISVDYALELDIMINELMVSACKFLKFLLYYSTFTCDG